MDSFDESITYSDLYEQNLSLIEGESESDDDNNGNLTQPEMISEELEQNVIYNEIKESLPEDIAPVIEVDDHIEAEEANNINYSFELNQKQKRCLQPILDLKFTNLRFTAIQICTYFYNDLHIFFYYVFHIITKFPIQQFVTDITRFIQQVGHFKHFEYVESMKIAFFHFFKNDIEFLPYCYTFFNTQFNTKCLTKSDIIYIIGNLNQEIISSELVQKIIFYEHFQFDLSHKKINRLEKEILRLKEKINDLSKFSLDEINSKKKLSYINDQIILDVINNIDKSPYRRSYNQKFVIFCSIACLFGRKCYNFLRKKIPLCSISFLKKSWTNDLNLISNCVFSIDNIYELISTYNFGGCRACLAIDAASFQKVKGETLIKRMPFLPKSANIDPSKVYSNVFVFLLQPLSKAYQTIPIHIQIHENGNASLFIIRIIKDIISYLNMYNIIIDFVATDGDRFYDFEHQLFFNDYIEKVYNFRIFEDIFNYYVINRIILPNSDLLHILKCVRRQLVGKDFIIVDYFNGITINVNEFEIYDFTKVLNDVSSNGGMKDSYPLLLYSFDTFKSACKQKKYAHAFYILGYCFLAEAVRNPILSNEARMYYLQVSFWVILYFYHQHNYVKNHGVHTKIGLIRSLNTILTIMISIQKYILLKLDRVGTHALECFFGIVRMACFGNHSFINMLNAIVRSIYIKKKLLEIDEEIKIQGRDNIGGTTTKPDSNEGVLPHCLPNEFFCIMLRLMKGIIINNDIEILEKFIEEKSIENDRFSSNFTKIYLQGPFAGSNISSRYRSNDEKKKKSKKESQSDEFENEDNTKMDKPIQREPTKEDFDAINLMMGQTPQVIQFYSLLNPKAIASGVYDGIPPRTEHFFNFTPNDQ